MLISFFAESPDFPECDSSVIFTSLLLLKRAISAFSVCAISGIFPYIKSISTEGTSAIIFSFISKPSFRAKTLAKGMPRQHRLSFPISFLFGWRQTGVCPLRPVVGSVPVGSWRIAAARVALKQDTYDSSLLPLIIPCFYSFFWLFPSMVTVTFYC